MIANMILILDNYDSFVYNIARYVARLGYEYEVHRNNKITIEEIKELSPLAIIISPGPCTPKEAGISINMIKELGTRTPILGVCLGHQAIAEAYGGKTAKAQKPMHGKSSIITHKNTPLFKNTPNPIQVGRYHSLIATLPETTNLTITANSESDEIMAIEHTTHPVYGVQFHPESVLTPDGEKIIENFLSIANNWREQ